MTNSEMFKTPIERRKAYNRYFEKCEKENLGIPDEFEWLDLEHKEELKPCPFCRGEARIVTRACGNNIDNYFVECKSCFGRSVSYIKQEKAVAAWNRRV